MHRIILSLLIVICAAVAVGLAQSSPSGTPVAAAPADMVSVTGTGIVRVTPDRMTFTVGIETNAATVDDAVEQNNRRSASVIAALKQAGAKDADIRTSNFSIFPQQEYLEGRRPRLIGYQVTNNITVTRDKPADAGRLLQTAVNAGANQASGLSWHVSDPARGRDQGLRDAFRDARAKAALLAESAGRTVGRAISITEGSAPMYPIPPPAPYAKGAVAMESRADVPVEQGSEEMRFTVSVIFELR